MLQLVLLLAAALAGVLLFRDGLRLVMHVHAADQMVAAGVAEPEALKRSGCLFWRIPWYKRLRLRYPPVPEVP